MEATLKLARLTRYARNRASSPGEADAEKWRYVAHLTIQVLGKIVVGELAPERLAALDRYFERYALDRRNDDAPGQRGNNHDNFGNSLDISGKSGSIKLETPRTDSKPGSGGGGKGGWVTINGTHIQVNENGLVTKGPETLMGKTVSEEATPIKLETGIVKNASEKPFSLANCRKTVMKYGISDAKALYESAKQGKRHGGVYRDAVKKTRTRLEKSISSHVSQVEEHADKLKHPIEHDIGWKEKNERQKEGLLHKWEKDLKRNAEQASIEMEVWKERFENDN